MVLPAENELFLLYLYQSPIHIVLGKRLRIHLLLMVITDPHISNEISLLDIATVQSFQITADEVQRKGMPLKFM